MEWLQVATIILSIIGTLGAFMFYMFSKLDKDITDVRNDLSGWTRHLTAMQAEQSKRTDLLNKRLDDTMATFISLVKEKR